MYESSGAALDGGVMAALGVYWFVMMIVLVLIIVAQWKVFTKAGRPGWASLIPIYNLIVLLEIVGRPIWWILLLLIPFVNIVIGVILMFDLAKSFGRGAGFALGLLFFAPIFYLILGFGSSRYVGPGGVALAASPAPPVYAPPAQAPAPAPDAYQPPTPPAPPSA